MLIRIKNNTFTFLKRKDFTSDKEYYLEIIKLKYKTSLKKNVQSKAFVICVWICVRSVGSKFYYTTTK